MYFSFKKRLQISKLPYLFAAEAEIMGEANAIFFDQNNLDNPKNYTAYI